MCDYKCRKLFEFSEEDFKEEMENHYILHWNYRNLEYFPEVLKYNGRHVEDLYFKGNCICNIPKWITDLKNLSEIHLAENKLTKLPEEISKLKFLRVLEVDDNQIAELPKSLTSLTQLNYLNASKNLLTKLPHDLGRLKALSHLYVCRNNLSQLPSSISGCISLSEINLDDNKLTSLPRSIVYLPNLETVSIRQNKIFYLPAIPFYAKPLLVARGNENLNHISQQVEHMIQNGEWSHLKLDESMDQYAKKNFIGSRNSTLLDYSIICTEKSSVLVIPMQVYNENDTTVPYLEEICLREADKLKSTYTRTVGSQQLLSQLPPCMRVEIESGPTALCQRCHANLYKFAFIRIMWNAINIVQYFCSKTCLKLFKNEITISRPEIQWWHQEIGQNQT